MNTTINFNTGIEKRCFDALIHLMSERTLEEVAIVDILKEADISRSTFYRHYLDKYDLLNKSYEKILENTILYGGEYGNFKATFMDLYEVLQTYSAFFAHAFADKGQNSLFDYIHQKMERVYSKMLMDHGVNMHDPINIYVLQGYIHGTLQITYNWLASGAKEDIDTILQTMYKLMPDMMRSVILTYYM